MTVTLRQPTVQVLMAAVDEYLLHEPVSKPEETKEGSLLQILQDEFPQVWAEGKPPGLAKEQPPVVVQLKVTATAVHVRQYPLPREAKEGIRNTLTTFEETGF